MFANVGVRIADVLCAWVLVETLEIEGTAPRHLSELADFIHALPYGARVAGLAVRTGVTADFPEMYWSVTTNVVQTDVQRTGISIVAYRVRIAATIQSLVVAGARRATGIDGARVEVVAGRVIQTARALSQVSAYMNLQCRADIQCAGNAVVAFQTLRHGAEVRVLGPWSAAISVVAIRRG